MTLEAQVRRGRARPRACTDYRCDRTAHATRTFDAHSFPQSSLPQPAPPCSVPQLRRSASRKALRTTRANSTLSLLSVSQCHACLGPTSRLPCGANAGRNDAVSKVMTHYSHHCATRKKNPTVHDASAQQSHCQADLVSRRIDVPSTCVPLGTAHLACMAVQDQSFATQKHHCVSELFVAL